MIGPAHEPPHRGRWRAPHAGRAAILLGLAAALAAGCLAAPTPHPERAADSGPMVSGGDVLADNAPSPTDYAGACAAAGGRWDDQRGLCGLDFRGGIDPEFADGVDASSLPGGADAGSSPRQDADSGVGQGADAGGEPPHPTGGPPATVTAVEVSGEAEAYTFTVTVDSPDEGCDRYADWWEVLRPDGALVYRRLMAHSHVEERPFARDGGPVAAGPDEVLVVRAHMHGDGVGYGGPAMVGTARGGFAPTQLPVGFAWTLAESEPLPSSCAF